MNNKIISGIVTAVIMAVLVAVLLAFGYDPPNPPIPEQGVEVNLGDSDFGSGLDPATQQPGTRATQSPAQPTHTVETFHETSLPQHPGTSTTDNLKVNVNVKVEKEPEINKNALFTGRRNRQSGNGSQGVAGGSGDQGKPNGNPNSNNYSAGGGANGMNYNLAGRSNVTLPRPNYTSNEQGTVVIQIWVDRDGRVTRAEYQPKGSNTSNGYLVSQAIAAARKARFNIDPSAPDEQRGTITYIFKI